MKILAVLLVVLFVFAVVFLVMNLFTFIALKFTRSKNETAKSNLRASFYGGLGFFVPMMMYAILAPQYSDYTGRTKVSEGLAIAAELKSEIEEKIKDNHFDLNGIDFSGIGKTKSTFSTTEVTDFGWIIIRGIPPRGQHLVILIPHIDKDAQKVNWECIGGPIHDMPTICRPSNAGH